MSKAPKETPKPSPSVKSNAPIQELNAVMLNDKKVAPIKQGWLVKQGNYIKNWRARWFVLYPNELFYFKDPTEEKSPTNCFLLNGAECKAHDKLGGTAFELTLPNGEKRYMKSDSKADRDEWVQLINAAGTAPSPQDPASSFDKDMKPEDFEFVRVVGKGNYGKVMLAKHKNKKATDPEYFAIKVIKKNGLSDDDAIEHVLVENRILQSLDHPFLVKLFYSFQTSDRLYFVMEYINGGELFYHITKERKFSEERTRLYIAEITLALGYLHTKGIVYRDLKLENLLLDSDGHVKVTDFGLCKEGIGKNDTTSTFCGTPEYLAPEVLEDETYGRTVDWWALGIVMYEMLCGRPPFGNPENVDKLFHAILHQPIGYPKFLSNESKGLLQRLLDRDATRRLGSGTSDAEEVKSHLFFKVIDWNKLIKREYDMPFKPEVKKLDDTGNFDTEFTKLPPILTPQASSQLDSKSQKEFEDFGYSRKDEK